MCLNVHPCHLICQMLSIFTIDEQNKDMLVQVERNVDKGLCLSQVGMSIEGSDFGLLSVAVKGLIQNDSANKFGDQGTISCVYYTLLTLRMTIS